MIGSSNPARNERGLVLLTTLLVLSLLIAIGIGARMMVHNDTGVSGNVRLSANAFYLAEAGIEWSKHQVRATSSHPPIPSNQAEPFASGGFSVAFVSAAAVTPLASRIVVRSTGTAGTSSHTLQARLTKTYDLADAAVALRGNGGRANLSGADFLISGADHDPTTGSVILQAVSRPGITVSDAGLRSLVLDGLEGGRQSNIAGEGGAPAVVRSNDLPGAVLSRLADDLCSTTQSVRQTVPADGTLSVEGQEWGTRSEPQLRCIDGLPGSGDAVRLIGSLSGVGILVVRDAELIALGPLRWEGPIMITGSNVGFKVLGSEPKEIYGSLMVNEVGVPSSETAILDIQGSIRVLFARSALNAATTFIPPSTMNSVYGYLPSTIVQDYWRMVTP